MDQRTCIDYINKIIILENQSHRIKNYKLLNPLDINGDLNIIGIQNIAKILSQHIGYDNLIFTISFKDFIESNIAGNVFLDDKEDVLIHISRNLINYPESILATLSHEISHKYIQMNGLTLNDSDENEIFTDLTSVYLGFGKLMLNGVQVSEKYITGYTDKTLTQNVGYLNRNQLAFIYLVINCLEGEKHLFYYSNLSSNAIDSVNNLEKEYSSFFKNIKFYRDKTLELNNFRYKLAYLQKIICITEPNNLNLIREFLKYEFTQLNETEKLLKNFKKEFLTRIIAEPNKTRKIKKDIPKIDIDILKYNKLLKINRKLVDRDLMKSIKIKDINIVKCPACMKNLRARPNDKGIIICPCCNFKFAVDTIYNLENHKFILVIKKIVNKIKVFFD